MKAAGVGPGDEVITVAYTCVATLSAIVHCGAIPVLVDVGVDFNIDTNLITGALTQKTRAILPVHLNGRPCDISQIMTLTTYRNLVVIEDAAQSPGARFNGQRTGTFGLAGCFSVYPMKMLGATGDGGFIATNDNEMNTRLRVLRDQGQDRDTGDICCHGFNSRLDNLQAAILNVKLKYLPDWINGRRFMASLYQFGLRDCHQITRPAYDGIAQYDVFQNYVIRAQQRDKLVDHLTDCGIETLTSWYLSKPLHWQKALNLSHFDLPNTEQFTNETISLPIYPEMDKWQVDYVIESIFEFYKNNG